ncbi:phosphotransferase [Alkalicoccobacillus porphyridii]|uniref:Aminoglycoside phosphotransferase domain-containing protein n=1 Tax=Alkalicoccobacillus porphyridii TaxID=2597270 RepID=A0A553ZYU4_9BACI|nr:phosphotransferase [Alkalicoccobacillus porphyridii]TSB46618.1 hypothetical protein FN960_09685 [Alkalicoccobacillus porphyridii]
MERENGTILSTKLLSFVNETEFAELGHAIKKKQRITYTNQLYFIKIALKENNPFIHSLLNEIETNNYLTNQPINCPKMLWSYSDTRVVILVFEKLIGQVLACQRDAFNIEVTGVHTQILQHIIQLQRISIPEAWTELTNRDDTLKNYYHYIKSCLPKQTAKGIKNLMGDFHGSPNMVFSHGDLLPMNIINSNHTYHFIDWEWAGVRSASFDPVLFMLFSRKPEIQIHKLSALSEYWEPLDIYKDALMISLREIKNWMKVDQSVQSERNIRRWIAVTDECLKRL